MSYEVDATPSEDGAEINIRLYNTDGEVIDAQSAIRMLVHYVKILTEQYGLELKDVAVSENDKVTNRTGSK